MRVTCRRSSRARRARPPTGSGRRSCDGRSPRAARGRADFSECRLGFARILAGPPRAPPAHADSCASHQRTGAKRVNCIGQMRIYVSPGTFPMGSPTSEADRSEDEELLGGSGPLRVIRGGFRGVSAAACRSARELFSRFPARARRQVRRRVRQERGGERSRRGAESGASLLAGAAAAPIVTRAHAQRSTGAESSHSYAGWTSTPGGCSRRRASRSSIRSRSAARGNSLDAAVSARNSRARVSADDISAQT